MADLVERVLLHVAEHGATDSLDLAYRLDVDHQKVVGAIKSIQSFGDVIQAEQRSTRLWELTAEGQEVAEKGSHEALVFQAIPQQGISQQLLMKNVPNAKVGFSKAMSLGWVRLDKTGDGGPTAFRKVDEIEDRAQQYLAAIQRRCPDQVPDAQKQDLKKRKLLSEVVVKSYLVDRGDNFRTSLAKPETELTPEMIASGSWKEKQFKEYNFEAMGVPPDCGHLHPLLKVRSEFRQIFFEMGFSEMPTNRYVESSFWNFDALFQPQQHPARDAHDTFFISEPSTCSSLPGNGYAERVAKVHSKGGYGSIGYQYDWKESEARKNLLRTHTTANSARMLHQLAQKVPFEPAKLFSIDRVFRNETLDATHLAEFCQIEGLVADYNLTLGNLMAIIGQFFDKLGMGQVRFKPAYNPYTEPSMEVFSFHEGLRRWVEVGNSGMFRPEMLLPMGLPEDVVVIAWGLSLERPTMIKYGINNIRDL
ncbi:phenylalanine--tRNA ligase alpha subunit, partial [Ixodes scapularis]|uniref:phenylalanine--tRNA ligase alpha subunit n=1 Tax=Ixodes scapularis TaxID=6945 RepID=UPI001C384107